MAKKVFALLLGIDNYPTSPLDGCVHDSEIMEEYLRTIIPADQLVLQTLRNDKATKSNVIDGFLQHLAQAKQDDMVFLHYAGHGSREQADQMFWQIEPDRQNEVMVLYDSIQGNEFKPLADKELRWLISRLAANNPNITLMLDCCHSGGGTRSSATSRYTAVNGTKTRSVNDYVFAQSKYGGNLDQCKDSKGNFYIPNGRHILMAGARSNQTAKELRVGDQVHGIFTYSVLETLKNSGGNITYSDLMKRASVRVLNTVSDQVPQLEAIQPNDLNAIFLQNAVNVQKAYYIVTKNKTNQWTVDAGSVHGIPATTVAPTTFALYKNTDDPTDANSRSIGDATTDKVLAGNSIVQPMSNLSEESYKAVVKHIPIPVTYVQFEQESPTSRIQQEGIVQLRNALATINGSNPSFYIKETNNAGEAKYKAIAYEKDGKQRYRIIKPTTDVPIVQQVDGFSPDSARKIIRQLEHISRYDRTAELTNTTTKLSGNKGIELKVWVQQNGIETLANAADGEIRMPYSFTNGEWQPASFKASLTNKSDKRLYVTALAMTSDFSVTNEYLPIMELQVGEEAFLFDGQYIPTEVAESWLKMGVNEEKMALKIIAATEQFDSSLLNMAALDMPTSNRSAEQPRNALEALMIESNHGKRAFGFGKNEPTSDWTTAYISFVATKNLTGEAAKPALAKVQMTTPKTFAARIGLASLFSRNSTRSLTNDNATESNVDMVLPPALDKKRPIYYGSPTANAPDLNVLVLSEVNNPQAVNAKDPLELNLPFSYRAAERLIPFASDGELFYPLGYAKNGGNNTTNIYIERLPEGNEAVSERGLGKTIKIVLQKLAGEKLGFPYNYPALCIATRNANDGKVEYNNQKNDLRTAVADKKVLLLIHGFSSDSSQLLSPNSDNLNASLYNDFAQKYDVVLTYDYDSFSTPISRSAQDLAAKLTEIGIAPQQLTIIAHCTGGLLARWFIENEGGSQYVKKLIMLGTPNNGTPWTRMKEWALVAATFAANQLTQYGIPSETIGFLSDKARLANELDQISKDVRIGSPFLEQLNRPSGVKVPYIIIAGNAALVNDTTGKAKSWVQRIFNRYNVTMIAQRALSLFLFGDKNDIAVSVRSMCTVDSQHNPQVRYMEIACDHFSYFHSATGMAAIRSML